MYWIFRELRSIGCRSRADHHSTPHRFDLTCDVVWFWSTGARYFSPTTKSTRILLFAPALSSSINQPHWASLEEWKKMLFSIPVASSQNVVADLWYDQEVSFVPPRIFPPTLKSLSRHSTVSRIRNIRLVFPPSRRLEIGLLR